MFHLGFFLFSYDDDQKYKTEIVDKFDYLLFVDKSVDTGDIDESLSDQSIRLKIRDNYFYIHLFCVYVYVYVCLFR
jgi:hypothetical protein